MPTAVVHCPLCASDRSQPFNRIEFRGRRVENRLCSDCGLVFQSPCMTEEEAAVFYQAEYRRLYQGDENPIAKDVKRQSARAESLIGFIQPNISRVSRFLDIGCSAGIILLRFQESYGCQIVGIEPGEAYRNYAAQQGIKVYATLPELEAAAEEKFDLICMAHVLEHLGDPVGYLAHLRESLLFPQGRLLIEVPNLYAHDSFEPAHLVAYSPHSLAQTVEKAGYEIINLERHGRPRSALLPLYITLLAKPRQSQNEEMIVHPEKSVALKRRLGMLRRRLIEKILPQRAWLKD